MKGMVISMKLIDSIIGSYSDRQIRKILPVVKKIEELADKYRSMSDEELRNTTPNLKNRLANGETLFFLTHLLP